jgi:Na+/H+ antiporter NhaD/arsenite permease-like protein
MTRVSSNIKHPRAWIFTQFSCANIASAILVSSNPTNLVLAGAFEITFIKYTANIIVPVLVTGVVLYPFLLYIIFHDESLIPASIKMEDLPDELKVSDQKSCVLHTLTKCSSTEQEASQSQYSFRQKRARRERR